MRKNTSPFILSNNIDFIRLFNVYNYYQIEESKGFSPTLFYLNIWRLIP